jgi:A/G-specific adenine glycosylase
MSGYFDSELRFVRRSLKAWLPDIRRTFFWREERLKSFEVLLVEVLLARTRAESAEVVARRLIRAYPDATALSKAQLENVRKILYPLGLQDKRARALRKLGAELASKYKGMVPSNLRDLMTLPYVGRYAANAVLCFAFGQRRPVVDANVARIFSRFLGIDPPFGKLESAEQYWELAKRATPRKGVRYHNWSLLDLGSLVCTPRNPSCVRCPLSERCYTFQKGARPKTSNVRKTRIARRRGRVGRVLGVA